MLNFGITFKDLYSYVGLEKLDETFLKYLGENNQSLLQKLLVYRLEGGFQSDITIELAPFLESFLIALFKLDYNAEKNFNYHKRLGLLFECRRKFIQRRVRRDDYDQAKFNDAITALKNSKVDLDDEVSIAENILRWLDEDNEAMLLASKIYASWVLYDEIGQKKYKDGVLFKLPKKLHFDKLIEYATDISGAKYFKADKLRHREGFDCTDSKLSQEKAITHANYCIHCHHQNKDSCSKGLYKKNEEVETNQLGTELKGCPLGEKISEMNFLKKEGIVLGAFATAIIDNPMVAGTGHRICNDCMKSCIYQKQEPVDIPLIETKILDDVLKLDWGFEIYSLLTRWNPLKSDGYLPKRPNNNKVLVVGLGPAGFTLAHYLINEGFTVVGIEGLKIEPMDQNITGITQDGDRVDFKPIKHLSEIEEPLSERKAYGFGGVVEYGITVRWNKNYLTILRLLLERRENFRMYGGIRFGSTITYNSAKELGFSHVALAVGAGKPLVPDIPNILVKGVKTASDFLMSLHTLGPARKNSLANLQIRLPIVVIGGGLTSIDTATESLAYYPIMVEKLLCEYEKISTKLYEKLDEEEKEIAAEFIHHAQELRKHPSKKLELLRKWGGAKIIYRKRLEESPAYRLSHEELEKALEEGVEFVDKTYPIEVTVDKYGHCKSVICNSKDIQARTIFIATGTAPNTTLSREDVEHFVLDWKYFKIQNDEFFTRIEKDFSMSVLGDAHPKYAGSVVKAMASAKNSYKKIAQQVLLACQSNLQKASDFFASLDGLLMSKVVEVKRLTPNVVELLIKAPLSAREFQPGQFYRLQNYESNVQNVKAMEPLALTGAMVDKEKGVVSFIVLEIGASSNICQHLKTGEIVSLMGPTGSPTYIPKKEMVILVGGGLGNAVLFSIGKALRDNGCYVLYFAGYKKYTDVFKVQEIEGAADKIIWCCDEKELTPSRSQDSSFHGNIVAAFSEYNRKFCVSSDFALNKFDRLITIGSDSMMKAVAYAIQSNLRHLFSPRLKAIASINSPMQCMMKEICAQCLQKHIDPKTQKISYVYSCFNQDQELALVDFEHLSCRLKQNSLLEKVPQTI
ncbi:FAD-dependent oxidoreductase [Candidatus Bandiella euplotis]|uniref:Bifunctional glutamate synthase subunit beta/2-polyprenylphenol hydroxylase family protein n=1 Tax=Candidatus Bandiella euplotis TaxID=1664265 RepID=A0ABZ0UNF4_9RICK|nr:FAD-dependent oxidoreductase [Candidatus Bandiella woodruffii]WPX97052.1 Putative bifunctional glutamate synthase subunit beta/2-polyprenylphenol hydroxylase family protein [Candidatus Bandiella woodruffii]